MPAALQAVMTHACLNQAQAQAFPASPPSAQQKCPPRELIMGVFFDGTDNNMYRDWEGSLGAGSETNVARLYRVYKENDTAIQVREKIYVVGVGAMSADAGVELIKEMKSKEAASRAANLATEEISGTTFGYYVAGLARGEGGQERLQIAYRWARSWCQSVPASAKKVVDVYGFSRGAAMARTFVNLINMGLKKEVPNLSVRFLGVFDTVGSFGTLGDEVDVGQNIGISSVDAAAIRHFTARHEIRRNFPLTALSSADREYAGAHSDVGGGYEAKEDLTNNHLAFVPLKDMHHESMDSGVELDSLAFPTGVNIENIRANAEKYWPAGSLVFDPNDNFALQRRMFYNRYMHTSHKSWPTFSNSPESSGVRRIFSNPVKKALRKCPPDYEWVE